MGDAVLVPAINGVAYFKAQVSNTTLKLITAGGTASFASNGYSVKFSDGTVIIGIPGTQYGNISSFTYTIYAYDSAGNVVSTSNSLSGYVQDRTSNATGGTYPYPLNYLSSLPTPSAIIA